VFACALNWPGWCRAGADEERSLQALAAAAPRYAAVAASAGVRFPTAGRTTFRVVERLDGSASTDFGAPGAIAARDRRPVTRAEGERLAALVAASWSIFDRVLAVSPPRLTKGPRGGGRDRDAIAEHVLGAEVSYARKLDLRIRQPAIVDRAAISAAREQIIAALRRPAKARAASATGWPAPYLARRIAWHVLDHAWEMEDRTPGKRAEQTE